MTKNNSGELYLWVIFLLTYLSYFIFILQNFKKVSNNEHILKHIAPQQVCSVMYYQNIEIYSHSMTNVWVPLSLRNTPPWLFLSELSPALVSFSLRYIRVVIAERTVSSLELNRNTHKEKLIKLQQTQYSFIFI